MSSILPPREALTICFAHVAYRPGERFAARNTGIRYYEVRSREAFAARIGEADVIVASGLWRNDFLSQAKRLRFIQSISAGTDNFDKGALRAAGMRLASAQGSNERAAAEHAMALILGLSRQLHLARDNQHRHHWRGMVTDPSTREEELGGKTLVIVGLGRIGRRLAALAKAFDMHVIGTKRDPSSGGGAADEIVADNRLLNVLPRADYVALTCPLTPETEKLIEARALNAMKRSTFLINVARGRCVDEAALIAALSNGAIAGAGLDVTAEEPLPEASPLWTIPTVLLTPHTAGETRKYEDNLLDLLMENLDRLWRGETELRNQVV